MPVVALASVFGLAWVAEHLAEVIAVSAACGVLSVAAVIWLMRWCDRRDAVRRPLWAVRAVTATAKPQVPQGTPAPPVERHVHYEIHYHGAGSQEAPGIPVIPGRVITSKEE